MSIENILSTVDLQRLDSAHFLHPFTDHKELSVKGSRIITHADNIYVWDSEGKKYLDAMSGLWCVHIGYGRKEIAKVANDQIIKLPFYNTFFHNSNEPAILLSEKLSNLTLKNNVCSFDYVFYTSGGSESVDTVVRMARRYWDLMGQKKRKIIISRDNSYHGSTLAGASLGGMKGMPGRMPGRIGIEHINQPDWYELSKQGETPEEFGVRAAKWLEDKILSIGPDNVAAFIAEPVQGTGGVIVPPDTYWPEIQGIVNKYGILLISDEVTCAFGRLGSWFGYEKFGYKPDLVAFAKGVTSGYIPLGGVLVGNKVSDLLINQGGDFLHGYTYSGHPVSCAVALSNIHILENENIISNVQNSLSHYFSNKLNSLLDHPLVSYIQTCGLMAGIKLNQTEILDAGKLCYEQCLSNGLITRSWEDKIIIAPPLIINFSQIDDIVNLLKNSLDSIFKVK